MKLYKKEIQDLNKAMRILNQELPQRKILPLNQVCYLDVTLLKQDNCLTYLNADYCAEISIQHTKEVIERRNQNLIQLIGQLEKQEEQNKQDDKQKMVDQQVKHKENSLQKKQNQEMVKQEQDKKQEKVITQELPEQNGQKVEIEDNVFEIIENYEDSKPNNNTPDHVIDLLVKLEKAFFDENIEEQQKLNKQLEKIQNQTKKQGQSDELKEDQNSIQPTQVKEEQPKRISKFKQERMNNQK